MPRLVVFPYKMSSQGARNIAKATGSFRVFPTGKYRPRPWDVILNWGNGTMPAWFGKAVAAGSRWLNPPEKVGLAVNKKKAFAHLIAKEVRCPEATTVSSVAAQWLSEGTTVVGRKTLTGTRGQGIVLMSSPEEFQACPLYTKYKPKKAEFRVHVCNGVVFDAQQKKRRKGAESNSKIRTEENGWVFCREGITVPDDVKEQARLAVLALGLDFGGVDVIWNEHEGKAYVLEVNTAPGLEGTTVSRYVSAIQQALNNN
jgi:glutathione synthase/RimK-type ligase-like ATP-grasp enzyme